MIGIFDSGSGGLSVLKAVRERAPRADIIYFGDLKNAPYGNKSREELGVLTVLGIQKLIDEGATEIVSACNSVSVSIVLPMFEILDIPRVSLIEMVGPTVSSFKGTTARVLVLATKATIESRAYQDGFGMVGVEAQGCALPDLVPLIEGNGSQDDMYTMIYAALVPYASSGYTHVLLGCTHFPLIRDVFAQVVGDLRIQSVLVDPAHAVADTVVQRFDIKGSGITQCITSRMSDVFAAFVSQCAVGEAPMIRES
jgi:glutamate racemase